jgi:DNA-binding transcriptional MerR regulator
VVPLLRFVTCLKNMGGSLKEIKMTLERELHRITL